jgi:hypothetical protein
MSIQIQGYGGQVVGEGGSSQVLSRALKVQCMPYEYGALGSYKIAKATGTMAAGLAAAAPIMSFRWTSATMLAIVTKVCLYGLGSLTGFTAGQALFELYMARSFSAVDSGGTALTLTTNNGKLRTSMGTTLLGDMRVSATATLTAGTRTLDAQPIGIYQHSLPVTANLNLAVGELPLFNADADGHPVILATQEGLVIQATVPATGTWLTGVGVCWTEVAAF